MVALVVQVISVLAKDLRQPIAVQVVTFSQVDGHFKKVLLEEHLLKGSCGSGKVPSRGSSQSCSLQCFAFRLSSPSASSEPCKDVGVKRILQWAGLKSTWAPEDQIRACGAAICPRAPLSLPQ